ncbi:hypothetical protein WJX77_006007 [Trebouxia sp. C0004]
MPAPRKQRSGVSFQRRPHHPTKDELEEMSAVDRLRRIEPFWKQLSHEERLELMTFSTKEVKAQALTATRKIEREAEEMLKQQQRIVRADSRLRTTCGPGCCGKDCGWVGEKHKLSKCPDEWLADGLKRLAAQNTWNQWQWDPSSPAFHSVHSFWEDVKDRRIPAALRSGLPKAKGTLQEQAALKRLIQRMAALAKKLTCAVSDLADDSAALEAQRMEKGYYLAPSQQEEQESMRIKQAYLGLIQQLTETLSEEDICLFDSIVQPAAQYVCNRLDEGLCPGSTNSYLCFADLTKLPEKELAKLCAWMTDQVDAIASGHAQVLMQIDTQLKAHHTSDDDDIGDVDIFVLTKDGMKLTVNPLWLAHLQTRIMFACGHVHRTQRGQDPYSIGAVLEWVFGMYVSKYEYGRNIAKTRLDHRPCVTEVFVLLLEALHQRQVADEKMKQSQRILEGLQQDRELYADLSRKYNLRLAESRREEPTALQIKSASVTDNNTLPARASICASPHGKCLMFYRAPPVSSYSSHNSRSTAQAGSSSTTSMGGAGRLDAGQAGGPTSTLPQSSANSQNSNREGSQQMLPDDVVVTLVRREMRLAYACKHAWKVNDVEEDNKLSELRRVLEQCQPQFAYLEAGMQQLDKHFLREKQKLDHLGKDCCVIPTLCELFPKLNKRAIQERCSMIDQHLAYEQEMQHYQKQLDKAEVQQELRQQGLEYLGLLGAHMVEILHAYEGFAQEKQSKGTARADSRLSEDKPSTQAAANTHQPVSGGVPQVPPQTDTCEPLLATAKPGNGIQHEDSCARDEAILELADADSIRQYFHQQICPGLRTVEYELSVMMYLQQHVKEMERFHAVNRAALIHLEAQVINVACDDPGRAVGSSVLLPMLRDRIESQAYAHYNKDVLLAEQKAAAQKAAKARKALEELIAEEEQEKAQAAASKARHQQIKAKQQQSKQLQEAKRAKKQRQKAKKQSGLQQTAPEQAATQPAAQQLSLAESLETGQQPPAQLNVADGTSTSERLHVPQGRGTLDEGSASLLQSQVNDARLRTETLQEASTASAMADVACGGQSLASSAPGTAQLHMDGSSQTQHVVILHQGFLGEGVQTGPQLQQQAAAEPVLQPQAPPPSSDSTDVQSMLLSQAVQQQQQQQAQQRSQTLAGFANSLSQEMYQLEVQHVASGEAGTDVRSSIKHAALSGHHGKEPEAVQQQAATSVVEVDITAAVSGSDRPAQQVARPWEAVLTPYKVPEEHVEALFRCPLTKALLIDPVVAADGHTYERQALQAWLQHHSISPITGEHLTHRHLVDNAVIKSLLQQQMLQCH